MRLFERLQKYQLKLNPAKCSFGVKTRKLLGFIVSDRGIEVDPDKAKAIQEMPAPKTKKGSKKFPWAPKLHSSVYISADNDL
jgi:hypothetical protein